MEFDVGWYTICISSFFFTKQGDVWLAEKKLVQQDIQCCERYWYLTEEAYLTYTAAILVRGKMFPVQETLGWELWNDGCFSVRVVPRTSSLLFQHTYLQRELCLIIESFHTTEPEQTYLYTPCKTKLNKELFVNGVSFDVIIQQKLREILAPLICVHELDQLTGDIHILPIENITYNIVNVTKKTDYSYVVTTLEEPLPSMHQPELSDEVCTIFKLDVVLTFHGNGIIYTVVPKSTPPSRHYLSPRALLIFNHYWNWLETVSPTKLVPDLVTFLQEKCNILLNNK